MFSRRDVRSFGPTMTEAIDRLVRDWDRRPDAAVLDAGAAMSGRALDVVGRALFSTDLTRDAEQLGRVTPVAVTSGAPIR